MIDHVLLTVCVLLATACLGAIVIVLLEVRTIRSHQARDQVPLRTDSGIQADELHAIRHELRSVREALANIRAALTVPRMLPTERDFSTATVEEAAREHGDPTRWSLTTKDAARDLLEECDSKPGERLEDIPSWVHESGFQVEVIDGKADDWFLIVLATVDGSGLVVPNLRRPMGTVDLNRFFDFVNYNGIDPLRKEKVKEFASVTRTNTGWSVEKKGLIRG